VLTLAVAAEGFAIGIGRPVASSASTEAVLVIPAVRFSVMTTVTLPAPDIWPRLQETVVPAAVHVPCPGAAEITVAPVTENVSVITTCGTAVFPVLLMVMEYAALEFWATDVGPFMANERLAAPSCVGAAGVIEFDGDDAGPSPIALLAFTTNV